MKRTLILWIIWIVLVITVIIMYFSPESLRSKIFIYFIAPISVIYFLLSFVVIPIKQLDIKLRFLWAIAIIILFFYGSSITKLGHGISLISRTFYTCWFLLFSISVALSGIYYENNKSRVLSDYAPSFEFNRSKNKDKGWISAYFWTAFVSFIVALMIVF